MHFHICIEIISLMLDHAWLCGYSKFNSVDVSLSLKSTIYIENTYNSFNSLHVSCKLLIEGHYRVKRIPRKYKKIAAQIVKQYYDNRRNELKQNLHRLLHIRI